MNNVQYRKALPDDIPEMTDLFLMTLSNMYARNSVSAPLPPRPAVLKGFEHVRSTGTFYVAELEGRIVGIGGSVVRDNIWYLSSFWVRPDLQNKKIGQPLLTQLWDDGRKMGARTFFTWSSIDSSAMALYMKMGMLPGYQILIFAGIPNRLPSIPDSYEVVDLQNYAAMDIDQEVFGSRREADHNFWLGPGGPRGRQVLRNGISVGYFYINHGNIGPAAWNDPLDANAVMTIASHEAAAMTSLIGFAVPGINHTALRFAFDSGLRFSNFFHFLTTAPFGNMERYLPSGPSLY